MRETSYNEIHLISFTSHYKFTLYFLQLYGHLLYCIYHNFIIHQSFPCQRCMLPMLEMHSSCLRSFSFSFLYVISPLFIYTIIMSQAIFFPVESTIASRKIQINIVTIISIFIIVVGRNRRLWNGLIINTIKNSLLSHVSFPAFCRKAWLK